MNQRITIVALVATLVLGAAAPAAGLTRFSLDNGLRVTLQPVPGATQVAVALFFDLGELHDPEGVSGLGHYVEHMLVTCATDHAPARTADAWARRYSNQCNAQTNRDYTLVAVVTSADRLEAELDDLAHRLHTLKVTDADLARELPRVELELANMYGGMPALAAMNHARAAADPLGSGARKGGRGTDLRALTAADVQARVDRYYHAGNARLVIVGGFAGEPTATGVRDRFGSLPVNEPAPAAATPGAARLGDVDVPRVDSRGIPGQPGAVAAAAFRAPAPDDPRYPAFLVVVAHLLMDPAVRDGSARGAPPFVFTPLDDPTVVFSTTSISPVMQNADAAGEASGWIRRRLEANPPPANASQAILVLGPFFGIGMQADLVAATNPYLAAFRLGRLAQMGVEPVDLEAAMRRLDATEIQACVESVFAPDRAAVAIVRSQRVEPIR